MDIVLFDNLNPNNNNNHTPNYPFINTNFPTKPRKKPRTLKIITGNISKPVRKKDPCAPKITRPCTECGKKFWSWKALFGHMRCHPERKWRGINPPSEYGCSEFDIENYPSSSVNYSVLTQEDHEVASILLLLANSPDNVEPGFDHVERGFVDRYEQDSGNVFECSSCKKVFGSHQALGGHRASHKNVKGCYAINRVFDDDVVVKEEVPGGNGDEGLDLWSHGYGEQGHRCSVCWRVFSSGQALGGHMRCHWEPLSPTRVPAGSIDLNFPIDHLGLDLRLGL